MPDLTERKQAAASQATAMVKEHLKPLQQQVNYGSKYGVVNEFIGANRGLSKEDIAEAVRYSNMRYSVRVSGKPGGERTAFIEIRAKDKVYKEEVTLPKGYDLKVVTVPAHKADLGDPPTKVKVPAHQMLVLIHPKKDGFEIMDTKSDRLYIDLKNHEPEPFFNYHLLSVGGAQFTTGVYSVKELLKELRLSR